MPSSPNLSTARRELIAAKESLAQQTDLIRQQEQEIASLLGGAEQDAAAGRLFSPASSNALLKYRQALSIDDTNADALKGRKVVVGKILAAVNDDIKNGRFIEAKGKIVTVAQFVPNDAAIKTSQLNLDRAQRNYKKTSKPFVL